MNKSSLLAVLKYPEDIAYWRHRVEIVMRPYRQLPAEWRFEVCSHEKKITVQNESQSIVYSCPTCQFTLIYEVNHDRVLLPNEVNMEQAIKRIATIERQFNDIATQSMNVIDSLKNVQLLKQQLTPFESQIQHIVTLQGRLENDVKTHPAVTAFKALDRITLPAAQITPDLLSLAKVEVPEIAVFKEAEKWKHIDFVTLEDELNQLHWLLQKQVDELQPKPNDVLVDVSGYQMTRMDLEKVEGFLEETELKLSLHILVQVLKGEATNKVRLLELHETTIFGLFAWWPEKYITRAMKEAVKR